MSLFQFFLLLIFASGVASCVALLRGAKWVAVREEAVEAYKASSSAVHALGQAASFMERRVEPRKIHSHTTQLGKIDPEALPIVAKKVQMAVAEEMVRENLIEWTCFYDPDRNTSTIEAQAYCLPPSFYTQPLNPQ